MMSLRKTLMNSYEDPFEAQAHSSIRRLLDDVAILLFVLAGIADIGVNKLAQIGGVAYQATPGSG